MGFNYGLEKKKFNAEWDRLRTEYQADGMSDATIQAVRECDWEQFKRERIFRIHTQSFEGSLFPEGDMTEDTQAPVMKKYIAQFSVPPDSISTWDRNAWIEDLDTPELAKRVKSLSQDDLVFLTYLIADGLSRAELSRRLNISRAAVTKRLSRIKKVLEKADARLTN